jgi:UDP-N-acetylmuramate dehydrogenase
MATRLKNESLRQYTSFKIGGPAEVLSMPDNVDELLSDIAFCEQNNTPYRILGNGSNILVSDKGVKGFVIRLHDACNKIRLINENTVEVGSGVSLQKFINFSIDNNLYGNEPLYSIPGTLGGAIYMNAGAAKASISDHLVSVTIFDGSEIRTQEKEDCRFGFRESIFQTEKKWIILSAVFELPSQDEAVGLEKKETRMKHVREHQDRTFPNVGSIFNKNYGRIARRIMRGKRHGNAMFSKRNGNWIINLGNATSEEVQFLIRRARLVNFFFTLKTAKLEIEIWE